MASRNDNDDVRYYTDQADEIDCPDCGGSGYDPSDGGQCDRCSGTGMIDRN